MSQLDYSFWQFGGTTTSTGVLTIKSGPGVLHTVNINSSGTGEFALYNATSSGAAALIAAFNTGVPRTQFYDLIFNTGLYRGNTTSTADVTVTWA